MKIKTRFEDFKNFVMRGNVFDLAVGVIVGGAFGKIVTSLVNDVIMPLLGLITGRIDLTTLTVELVPEAGKKAAVMLNYGSFLQNVIDFLIIAVCIYLFIKLVEQLKRRQVKTAEAPSVPTRSEELLAEIRDLLKEKKEN